MKEGKKLEYWNHFLTLKSFWGNGVTLKRLEKVKPIIWEDNYLWSDILERHGGNKCTPEEMRETNNFNFDHCFGNMAGMIYQCMLDNKILKY